MSDKLDFIYDSETFIDLYEILDIDMEAKNSEIKSAYLKLAKIHHPDHGGNSEMFEKITKAYEILYNRESRKEYDLYYLKKSMNEFSGDDLSRLKSDYTNFVNANTVPISKEKLDEIYSDIFKDRDKFKEELLESDEFNKRINDINVERENVDIDCFDDKFVNLINELNKNSDSTITISDIFEYLKSKNNNSISTEIIIGGLGTLDTLPGYGNNYTSFISDNDFAESNLYSTISNNDDVFSNVEQFNFDDFNGWKNKKPHSTKLSQNELDDYLEKRKNEENNIFDEVEHNLNNVNKKKEIQKFLHTKHLEEDIGEYYSKLSKNQEPNTDDIFNYMDKIKSEESEIHKPSNISSNISYYEQHEKVDNEDKKKVINNVRKRELK